MLYTDTGLSHPNTVLVSTAVMGGAGGGEEGLWGGGWHFLHLVLTIPDNAGVQSREPLRVLGGGQPTIPRDP